MRIKERGRAKEPARTMLLERRAMPGYRGEAADDRRPLRSLALLVCVGLLAAGCASLPTDYPRPQSTAFADHQSTTVGAYLAEQAAEHPGESGFAMIRRGREAFTARVALTELAERTIDLQYYIWEEDATGRILADALVRAADRGVRVRLLLDDMNFAGRDVIIAALDAHPNIEIRMFNPLAHRRARVFSFIGDFNRVNHRMHNKLLVTDNAMAIVGGRNIGDDYFQVDTEANFRDLDIAAGGPIVRQISNVFDHFFNGDWSVPISALVKRPYTDEDLDRASQTMRERISADQYPYRIDEDTAALKKSLESEIDSFVWAPGEIVWDDPAEIQQTGATTRLHEAFHWRAERVESELLIESAYFIPRERGIAKMAELHDRGVRIRILTNSLVSNDVLAAHAGYADRRKQVLEAGAELYELRVDAGTIKKRVAHFQAKAALHTKALVFDRKAVFIGSLNLDPRSTDLNTEAGLYVESPELAQQLADWMEEAELPENSYRVLLDGDGDLVWVTEEDGTEVRYDKDPQSTFWQRFMVGFIGLFPVEDQL
jgi:putative cardiolipin synthase